jgi:hypothetical protein
MKIANKIFIKDIYIDGEKYSSKDILFKKEVVFINPYTVFMKYVQYRLYGQTLIKRAYRKMSDPKKDYLTPWEVVGKCNKEEISVARDIGKKRRKIKMLIRKIEKKYQKNLVGKRQFLKTKEELMSKLPKLVEFDKYLNSDILSGLTPEYKWSYKILTW